MLRWSSHAGQDPRLSYTSMSPREAGCARLLLLQTRRMGSREAPRRVWEHLKSWERGTAGAPAAQVEGTQSLPWQWGGMARAGARVRLRAGPGFTVRKTRKGAIAGVGCEVGGAPGPHQE